MFRTTELGYCQVDSPQIFTKPNITKIDIGIMKYNVLVTVLQELTLHWEGLLKTNQKNIF